MGIWNWTNYGFTCESRSDLRCIAHSQAWVSFSLLDNIILTDVHCVAHLGYFLHLIIMDALVVVLGIVKGLLMIKPHFIEFYRWAYLYVSISDSTGRLLNGWHWTDGSTIRVNEACLIVIDRSFGLPWFVSNRLLSRVRSLTSWLKSLSLLVSFFIFWYITFLDERFQREMIIFLTDIGSFSINV